MLSLQLDISALRIVIVGGGKVAARKVAALLSAGEADITVVAPRFAPDFPVSVKWIEDFYQPSHLTGAAIVFAATDSADVNAAVTRDAHAIGALVNRADVDDDADADVAGDFTLPAKADLGDVRLTISAGSPALASAIRAKIVAAWDPRWSALAAAMKTLRPWIVAKKDVSPEHRARIFRDLASDEAIVQTTGGVDALKTWITARHDALQQGIATGDVMPSLQSTSRPRNNETNS